MTQTADTPREKWTRRVISIGVLVVGGFAFWSTAPVLLPLCFIADLFYRRHFALTRCLAFFLALLFGELWAVIGSAAVWLVYFGRWRGEGWLAAHYAMQRLWSAWVWHSGRIAFGMEIQLEGAEGADLGKGPYLLMVRHASTVDTVLPAVFIANRFRMRFRYVLKRELLWDPALDIVGRRIPNYFLDRRSKDPNAELQALGELVQDLGEKEGALIFPEGTRFTETGRTRAIARIKERSPELFHRAEALRGVMPPRPRGTLAMLRAAPELDVVVLAHAGIEQVRSLPDMFSGAMVGLKIRVRFWRVRREEIPTDEAAQVDWLYAQWARVDDFVLGGVPKGRELPVPPAGGVPTSR